MKTANTTSERKGRKDLLYFPAAAALRRREKRLKSYQEGQTPERKIMRIKALIFKDTAVLWKQMRYLVLVLLLLSLLQNDFAGMFLVIWGAMLPYTAMAYDERCKWDDLAAMMPYSVWDLVLSKYLLGWLCVGVLASFSALLGLACRLLPLPMAASSLSSVVLGVCFGACALALSLPLMFRFGVEKGRMMGFVMIALVCGGAGAASALADFSDYGSLVLPLPVTVLSAAIAAALTAVSVPLSVRLYRRGR